MDTHSPHKKQLAELTKTLIHSSGIQEEIVAAKALSSFYAQFVPGDALHQQRHNEVQLKGGFALSSYDAAICIDEYIRTARFIKGTYLALCELFDRFPSQKLNVLYAGCGPYATLILPLLPLFDVEKLDVLLLDINEASLQSVKYFIQAIGLEDYTIHTMQGDAIRYQAPASKPLHLVVTETMFRALIREPQVSITENLAPQLVAGGILVPEEISIDMVYTFFGKEPFLQSGDEQAAKAPYPYRVKADRLFSINKELDFYKQNKIPGKFESRIYELPLNFAQYPDLCVFTSLRIFGEIMLDTAESSITNPHCMTSFTNLQTHPRFKLEYYFSGVPEWTYELKA